MNNAMKKLMISGLAALAVCGSALAAPQQKADKGRAPAPVIQRAQAAKPAPARAQKPAPAPKKQVVAKPMQKPAAVVVQHKEPAHRAPPPPQRYCKHSRRECHECNRNVSGAALLGALVGGLVGALVS